MNTKNAPFLLFLAGLLSLPSLSVAYSLEELKRQFNLTGYYQEISISQCSDLSLKQKPLCEAIKEKITALSSIRQPLTVHAGTHIYTHNDPSNYKKGNQRIKHVWMSFHTDSSGYIGFNHEQGLTPQDPFLTTISAPINVRLKVSGDITKDTALCVNFFEWRPIKADLGWLGTATVGWSPVWGEQCTHVASNARVSGRANIAMHTMLINQTKVVENDQEYIVFFQPKFRILSNHIDIDKNSLNYTNDVSFLEGLVLNLVNQWNFLASLSTDFFSRLKKAIETGDISIHQNEGDDKNSAFNTLISLGETLRFFQIKLIDILELAKPFGINVLDDAKKDGQKLLYQQEQAINQAIANALHLNASGVAMYRFPKSQIHKNLIIDLLPAIQHILNSKKATSISNKQQTTPSSVEF